MLTLLMPVIVKPANLFRDPTLDKFNHLAVREVYKAINRWLYAK